MYVVACLAYIPVNSLMPVSFSLTTALHHAINVHIFELHAPQKPCLTLLLLQCLTTAV